MVHPVGHDWPEGFGKVGGHCIMLPPLLQDPLHVPELQELLAATVVAAGNTVVGTGGGAVALAVVGTGGGAVAAAVVGIGGGVVAAAVVGTGGGVVAGAGGSVVTAIGFAVVAAIVVAKTVAAAVVADAVDVHFVPRRDSEHETDPALVGFVFPVKELQHVAPAVVGSVQMGSAGPLLPPSPQGHQSS